MLANRAPCPLCTTLPLHCWWKGFWKDATEFFCHSNVLKYCPCPVIIPAVGSRTFNPPRAEQAYGQLLLSTVNNYRDAAGGMEPMLLSRSARKCRNLAKDADLFDVYFEKMAILIFVKIAVSRTVLHIFVQCNVNSSALTYFNISPRVWYRFALPHSAYSIICYLIIKSVVIIHPLKVSNGNIILKFILT